MLYGRWIGAQKFVIVGEMIPNREVAYGMNDFANHGGL
jgi:hypothetical protein